MKVADLYILKPATLGVASLMLTDGRALIDALNTYQGIQLPKGQRVTILSMQQAIENSGLSEEDKAAIAELDIDESSVTEANPVDLSPLNDVGVHGFSQNFAIVTATIVMAVITLAYTAFWGWLVYTEHIKPSLYAMGFVIFPWLAVVWKSQGIISRERRDVLSVLVGDTSTQKGLIDKLGAVTDALRK